jgi:hypothetical protein
VGIHKVRMCHVSSDAEDFHLNLQCSLFDTSRVSLINSSQNSRWPWQRGLVSPSLHPRTAFLAYTCQTDCCQKE